MDKSLSQTRFRSNCCVYMGKSCQMTNAVVREVLGLTRSLSVDQVLRSARIWAWQRKYKQQLDGKTQHTMRETFGRLYCFERKCKNERLSSSFRDAAHERQCTQQVFEVAVSNFILAVANVQYFSLVPENVLVKIVLYENRWLMLIVANDLKRFRKWGVFTQSGEMSFWAFTVILLSLLKLYCCIPQDLKPQNVLSVKGELLTCLSCV